VLAVFTCRFIFLSAGFFYRLFLPYIFGKGGLREGQAVGPFGLFWLTCVVSGLSFSLFRVALYFLFKRVILAIKVVIEFVFLI